MEQDNSYKLLTSIDTPEDLRKLKAEQLPEVCKELRQKIIDELSCNPGHFGSSLGVIELTVALHYVFNTPYDRIVWDVGHQAYGHKILTGRRDVFHITLLSLSKKTQSKFLYNLIFDLTKQVSCNTILRYILLYKWR